MNKNERTWFLNSYHEINILVDFSVSHVSSSQLRKQNTGFDSSLNIINYGTMT